MQSFRSLLQRPLQAALTCACLMASALPTAWAARDLTPRRRAPGSSIKSWMANPLGVWRYMRRATPFFMQVFGYEKNGDATFYTATGQMDGNTVTAPLMRYRGGRSFGGEARDAVEDG